MAEKPKQDIATFSFGFITSLEGLHKYSRIWVFVVFSLVFLGIASTLVLATNPCAGQAAVVLGWVTLAIYSLVFAGFVYMVVNKDKMLIVAENVIRFLKGNDDAASEQSDVQIPPTVISPYYPPSSTGDDSEQQDLVF